MQRKIHGPKTNIKTTVALLCFLGLGACAFVPPSAPDDLKFVSARAVDSSSLPASIQQDILHYKFNQQPRKILEVTFSSNGNIVEYKKNWGDTYLTAVACGEWAGVGKLQQDASGGYVYAGPLGMGTSSVYWKDIDALSPTAENTLTDKDRPFVYRFYVDISRKSEQQPRAQYDLRLHVEDICFQITSAEMTNTGAKSNIVTIPKEAVAAALTAVK